MTEVFYVETPDGLRCLWEPMFKIVGTDDEFGEVLYMAAPSPDPREDNDNLFHAEECSEIKEAEALPSMECPKIDDEGYYCKSCERGCINGRRYFAAGPITVVKPRTIVEQYSGITVPGWVLLNMDNWSCMTSPLPPSESREAQV